MVVGVIVVVEKGILIILQRLYSTLSIKKFG